MSAAKRRIKRKIRMLVRMDDTRSRMDSSIHLVGLGQDASYNFWHSCMKPLAAKLDRMGQKNRTLAAMNARVAWRVYTGGNP